MLREVLLLGPARTEILVGRSIERELGYLHRLAWQLGFTSLGALAVGLLGGWWIAGKATRPIEAMSSTAASVTASSLSQRIEVEDLEDEFGRLAGILNSMLDRIEEAFHQQRRFTADASHELRTPLAVVLSHLELALSRPRSVEEYRDSLETCLKAARRMKSIVEDLLLLARADAGKLELRKQRVDLRNLAVECASLFEPLAAEKHVRLLVQGSPVPATVDPDRFSQVLNNLTANAVRHCRPGGEVRLSAAALGEEITLTVEDDGEGIPTEHLPRIFDRFYRVDAARSRESGGSGLGLAICKSIVEIHGGRITVASEPDRGASFVIHLDRSSRE